MSGPLTEQSIKDKVLPSLQLGQPKADAALFAGWLVDDPVEEVEELLPLGGRNTGEQPRIRGRGAGLVSRRPFQPWA